MYECLEGATRLMRSDFAGPVNIGSEEMVTINQLAALVMEVARKVVTINHKEGPLGVPGVGRPQAEGFTYLFAS